MPVSKSEIQTIIWTFYNPRDTLSSRYKVWIGDPDSAVREVLAEKKVSWDENQIRLTSMLMGQALVYHNFALANKVKDGEKLIRDAIGSIQPSYMSTLVMHNVTFYLGATLILVAVCAAYIGQEVYGLVFGSVGLTTVISFFFLRPVRGIQGGVAVIIMLEIIFRSYVKQLGYWMPYTESADLQVKRDVMREIERCTRGAVELIQRYCEDRVRADLEQALSALESPRPSGEAGLAAGWSNNAPANNQTSATAVTPESREPCTPSLAE